MQALCILCCVFQSSIASQPDLFLLKTYQDKQAVVGWVMSEKLDGVRGFWDGKQLISRGGKVLTPPSWFVANYPPFAIDGELWTRRGDFENISSIVRSKRSDHRWRTVTHQIFEVPEQMGGLTQRLEVLGAYLAQNPSQFIKIITQTEVQSKQQLDDFLTQVINAKGEGVVVRDPKTPYATGRLSNALKVKKHHDAECIVVEILSGKGKYKDKMGALKCQLLDGKMVKIGSGFSDIERENPPKVGTQITFKYYGLTKYGKFKYPVFLKKRPK